MEYAIYIKDIEPESLVDGIGIRTVIFCTGCDFKCENCHNEQIWDMNSGYLIPIQKIYDSLGIDNPTLSGVTFSGGEPMKQAKAFHELAKMIKNNSQWDIWCYTGYLFEDIVSSKDDKYELLQLVDVLVDGQYVDELKKFTLAFRGSSNQRIIDVQKSLKQNAVVEMPACSNCGDYIFNKKEIEKNLCQDCHDIKKPEIEKNEWLNRMEMLNSKK